MKNQEEVPSYPMPQPQAIGFEHPPSYASSVPPPHPSAPEYPVNTGSAAPPPLNPDYQPPLNAGYQPPPHAGYQPPPSAGCQPPLNAGYQPPLNAVNQSTTTTYVYPSGPAHAVNVLPRTYCGGYREMNCQRKVGLIIAGVALFIMIVSLTIFFTTFSRH